MIIYVYQNVLEHRGAWHERSVVATSKGAGASLWGKLKSGVGWLSLDYVQRV